MPSLGGVDAGEDQAAREILDLRHEDNTKHNYKGKIRRISAFLLSREEYHFALTDDNELDPAKVSFSLLTAIFGELGTNPDYASTQSKRRADALNTEENNAEENDMNNGRGSVTIAVSTMQGYKSAIVNYFQLKQVVWSKEFDNWVEQYIDGYGKLIAEKKEKGVMAMQEGKNHLQFSAYQELTKYMMSVGPPQSERDARRLTQIDGRGATTEAVIAIHGVEKG